MLKSKVMVTRQNLASPSSSKGSLQQLVTKRRQRDSPCPPPSTPPALQASQSYPHFQPQPFHPQTQRESKLVLAAKENISESHKRYFFLKAELRLVVTGWLAKRPCSMAFPRASGAPSSRTGSKSGPSHLCLPSLQSCPRLPPPASRGQSHVPISP